MALCLLQDFRAVRGEEIESALDRLDHGARRDGGAGHLIEDAAILLHRPLRCRQRCQRQAVERQNPR
jgi:hypothetical protein